MFVDTMKKIELEVLKADFPRVMERAGKLSCLEISQSEARAAAENYNTINESKKRVVDAANWLGASLGSAPAEVCPKADEIEQAEKLAAIIEALRADEDGLLAQKARLEADYRELSSFMTVGYDWQKLEAMTYLTMRFGQVEESVIPTLEKALEGRAVILRYDEGSILAFSSKKGRFALDTELGNARFISKKIPEDKASLDRTVLVELERSLAACKKGLEELSRKKQHLLESSGPFLSAYASELSTSLLIETVLLHLHSTETTVFLEGWIPAREEKRFFRELQEAAQGRLSGRSYKVAEVGAVLRGEEQVPVRLKPSRFFNAFSGIVSSYGTPLYGVIDPTPFVTFFFLLLFSIMFGDVGQGFVIFLGGVLVGRLPALKRFARFSIILRLVGIGSMFTGLLYGSVFTDEHLLVEPTRWLTGTLFGTPLDRIVAILPQEGIDKLLYFFAFTLAIGFLMNSSGLILNIINSFRLGRIKSAVFAKTGLAGLAFFWYAVFFAIKTGLGATIGALDFLLMLGPLFLVAFGQPVANLVTGHRPLLHEGIGMYLMEGFVELIETLSYFFSNTVSFLRVGAFALSHAVLSLIIFQLAEMLSHTAAGVAGQVALMIVGNALIIGLEGMIVAIQVIRLNYYEFFSKFFSETGRPFRPFTIHAQETKGEKA